MYGQIFNNRMTFYNTVDGRIESSVNCLVSQKYRTGGKTVPYRKPPRTFPLPDNSYEVWGTKRRFVPGSFNYGPVWNGSEWKVGGGVFFPGESGYVDGDDSHIASVVSSAMANLQNKASKMQMNYAQFFAERNQLRKMMIDSVTRLANVKKTLMRYAAGEIKHFRAVKTITRDLTWRGSGSRQGRVFRMNLPAELQTQRYKAFYRREFDANRLSGNVASDWLALQYGWLPLLSDTKAMAEHCAQRALDAERTSVPLVIIKSGAKTGTSYSTKTANSVKSGVKTSSCRVTIRAKVNVQYLRTAQNTGLNPLTLAWELMPYSFVVDWFADVGDYLNRLTYSGGLTFHSGYYTIKTVNDWVVLAETGNAVRRTTSLAQNSGQNYRVTREKLYAFPSVVPPRFSDPWSPIHAANALALLRTANRRSMPTKDL